MFKLKLRYLFILLLSVYSYLNILVTVGNTLFDFEISSIHLLAILTFVVFGVWELNRLADHLIERYHLASRLKIHPLILLFLFSAINVCLTAIIGLKALYLSMGMPNGLDVNHVKLLLAFGFRVNLFLQCINAIVFFMNRLKQTQLQAEQLKKVSIEAQFEALRAQINPHFLFNCFNVLSSLVYKDADTSAKFIGQLSSVYRYLLYNQEKKVVPLQEELAFLNAYFYLLHIRFGDNIIINNTLDHHQSSVVPPAVLQMLVENAIKHNVVSKKHPLIITITEQNNKIVVSNNLQPKEQEEDSTKIGLRNICDRYRFLSDEEVHIIKSENTFEVQLPLLKLELV